MRIHGDVLEARVNVYARDYMLPETRFRCYLYKQTDNCDSTLHAGISGYKASHRTARTTGRRTHWPHADLRVSSRCSVAEF